MESCSPRNVAPGLSAAYSISYAFIRSTMMSEPYAALERPDVAATRSTAWTSWPSLIPNLRSAYVESTPHPTLSPLKVERKERKVSLLFFWLRATQPAQLFAGQRSHQGAEPVRQRRLGACFKCDLHGLGKIFVRPGQVDEVEFSQRENRSEEHTSELQSPYDLVCRLLLEKKNRVSALPSSSCWALMV